VIERLRAARPFWPKTKDVVQRRVPALRGVPSGVSQSNESELLVELSKTLPMPRTFIEIGFHPAEFNCIGLARLRFKGLLVDGDAQSVDAARASMPRRITPIHEFLDLDNIDSLLERFSRRGLGVLSIDVDGNDFWFARRLLPGRPVLLIVEYNASFGLRPITVPYDPRFDRHEKHPSGLYHGASLTALMDLTSAHGYQLAAVTEGGMNAIFARSDVAQAVPALDPSSAYRENALRNQWSGTTADQQWETIKQLEYVDVRAGALV